MHNSTISRLYFELVVVLELKSKIDSCEDYLKIDNSKKSVRKSSSILKDVRVNATNSAESKKGKVWFIKFGNFKGVRDRWTYTYS